MTVALTGVLVIVTFTLVALDGFNLALRTGWSQTSRFTEASELETARLASLISINSITFPAEASPITVTVDNLGGTTISIGADMDIILHYIPEGAADPVLKRLTFVAGVPGHSNEWGLGSISTDTINQGLWDPLEQASLLLHPEPHVKLGETHTVVVVSPNGVVDSSSFLVP